MPKTKLLFLILITIIIASFSYSCKRKTAKITIISDASKNHWQRTRLFGKVKNVETETYYYTKKDSLFFFSNKNIQYYSSDGYITHSFLLNEINDTVYRKSLFYLQNANENYWIENNYKDSSVTKDTFIYDKIGFKSEERMFQNDSLILLIKYKTDAIGNIIEMKRFLPEYILTNIIYYNEIGLVERVEEYDPQNKLFKYASIEYDNYGDEVNRRVYKDNNTMIEYTYTQYNNAGWLKKIIFEDHLHSMREDRIYFKHDSKGNWLEEITLRGIDTVRKRARIINYY